MPDCQFLIGYDDFVMIWIGAGVGYFVIGYYLANCIHKWRNPPPEPLIAQRV